MVNENLLNIVMLVEVGLLAIAVVLFFTHGVWLFLDEKRLTRLSKTARDALAQIVTRGTIHLEQIEILKALPPDVQVIAFLEISRNLAGTGKERLRFAAQQVGAVSKAQLESFLETHLNGTRTQSTSSNG